MINEMIGKDFSIEKQIDNGGTSAIYLVKSIKDGKNYVAKVYYNLSKYFYKEVMLLKKISTLNSSNIIHLISYGEEPIIKNGIPEKEKKQFIIMDYIPNKDLFFYISNLKGLDEKIAKKLFYKILKAVQQCHNLGICHRDLKLENILLNENYEPVLCDFGFSSFIKGEDGSLLLREYLGTKSYSSPEILRKKPYYGIKCDIFSLGVILFCLIFGNFGFGEATVYNYYYKLIIKKNYEQYWEEIGKALGKEKMNKISPEFKKLYLKMVAYNPNERPSIEEILNDDWMKNI